MTEKGVSFTAAQRICFLLISPQFPTVTRQKGRVRKGGKERERGEKHLGSGFGTVSRSAIIKKRTVSERRNVSHSRNVRELLTLWIQQAID